MELELQRQLARDFPFMRAHPENNKSGIIKDSYTAFGCECGDGWYSLLYNLCTEITAAYTAEGLEVGIRPKQIKQKFGGLRFYYYTPGKHLPVVSEIITKHLDLADRICEECGQQGKHRVHNNWELVRCDDCYEAIKANKRPEADDDTLLTAALAEGEKIVKTLQEFGSLWASESEVADD
jgi:hypothetical protein